MQVWCFCLQTWAGTGQGGGEALGQISLPGDSKAGNVVLRWSHRRQSPQLPSHAVVPSIIQAVAVCRGPYLTGWWLRDIPNQPQIGTRQSHVKPQIQVWRCTNFCKIAVVLDDFTSLCEEIYIAEKSWLYRSIQTFLFPLILFILSTMRFLGYVQAFAGRKHHLFSEAVQLVHGMNYFILNAQLFLDFIRHYKFLLVL